MNRLLAYNFGICDKIYCVEFLVRKKGEREYGVQNMKRLFFLVFFMFFAFKCFAESGVQERFSNGQKYLLRLPQGYTATEKRYPLLIAIHWFRGNASQTVNEWGFVANKNGCILVCPEFADGYQILKKPKQLNIS